MPQTTPMFGMNYAKYLESPEWKHRRDYMLRRADHRCELCNEQGDTLDVHHRTYERLGREYDADLIVLCRRCHTRHHKPKTSTRKIMVALDEIYTYLEPLRDKLIAGDITPDEMKKLSRMQIAIRELLRLVEEIHGKRQDEAA